MASLIDLRKDGDTVTVQAPFGSATFALFEGDASVGIQGGIGLVSLALGGLELDADELPPTIVTALQDWAWEEYAALRLDLEAEASYYENEEGQ